jgi:hypothetical protein
MVESRKKRTTRTHAKRGSRAEARSNEKKAHPSHARTSLLGSFSRPAQPPGTRVEHEPIPITFQPIHARDQSLFPFRGFVGLRGEVKGENDGQRDRHSDSRGDEKL